MTARQEIEHMSLPVTQEGVTPESTLPGADDSAAEAAAVAMLRGLDPPADKPAEAAPPAPPAPAAAEPAAAPEPAPEPTFEERIKAAVNKQAEEQAAVQAEREARLAAEQRAAQHDEAVRMLEAARGDGQALAKLMEHLGWTPETFSEAILDQGGRAPATVKANQVDAKVRQLEAELAQFRQQQADALAAQRVQQEYNAWAASVPAEVPAEKYPTLRVWADEAELVPAIHAELVRLYDVSGRTVTPTIADAATSLERQLSARVKRIQQGNAAPAAPPTVKSNPVSKTITNELNATPDAQHPEPETDEELLAAAIRTLRAE